jgi:hypothetical protein
MIPPVQHKSIRSIYSNDDSPQNDEQNPQQEIEKTKRGPLEQVI